MMGSREVKTERKMIKFGDQKEMRNSNWEMPCVAYSQEILEIYREIYSTIGEFFLANLEFN